MTVSGERLDKETKRIASHGRAVSVCREYWHGVGRISGVVLGGGFSVDFSFLISVYSLLFLGGVGRNQTIIFRDLKY